MAFIPSDFKVTGAARPIFSQLARSEQKTILHEIAMDQQSRGQVIGTLHSLKDAPARYIAPALNAAADSTRDRVVKRIVSRSVLSEYQVDPLVTVSKRAKGKRDAAVVTISGKKLPLTEYVAVEGDEGVYARTYPGSDQLFDRAFVATMPDGSYGVWRRAGDERLPIAEVKGPSVAELVEQSPGLFERLELDARQELAEQLAQAVLEYNSASTTTKQFAELAYLLGID